MIRQNYTAIVERNQVFEYEFTSEPYECGWASEAIFFVRKLETFGLVAGTRVYVQISPDGLHWINEGTSFILTDAVIDFCKVKHFGNWLRLQGKLPPETRMKGLIALNLKE